MSSLASTFVLASVALSCLAQVPVPEEVPERQAPPPETFLPEVRVKARAKAQTGTGPLEGYVARQSTGATRMDLALAETPQSVSVIGAEQIREQNATTMQEVLRYTPGVSADVYGLDNRGDWFMLRGASEGSTLLDGLRQPLTGWYGVVRNEPFAFERVEVLRGPASVIAGQNGPGGVVNLVSKRPLAQAQHEVDLQLGTRDHRILSLDFSGPVDDSGTLLYRLVALGKASDTQVQHADEERQLVAPSLTWKPGEATSLTVFSEYQHDRSRNTEGFFPIVGTLVPGPSGYIPTDTFVSEPDWDAYGGQRTRVGYRFEQRLSEAWTLRQSLRHDQVDGKLRSMYANYWEGFLPDGRSLNRTWYASDDSMTLTAGTLDLEGKLPWGPTRHTVLVGLDGLSTDAGQTYLSGAATPLDVYSPVYGAFPHPDLAFGPATVTRMRQTGLMVQDQVKFGEHWIVLAGLRRDHARATVAGAPSAGNSDSALSSNLGAVYRVGPWSPYLNYSESFESVGGADVHGVAYKPKRGKQLEGGVKFAPQDGRFGASAALFELRETHRLTPDPADPANQVQGGEVTVRGLEVEGTATLPALDLMAKFAYTDAKVTASSDPGDPTLHKRVPNVPGTSASLWALHKFKAEGLPGLKAGLGLRYVGTTWDGTDSLQTPSNTLVDARLSWDRGTWTYAVNATNLLDTTYFTALLDRGDAWFGTRRRVVASLTYRW